ncbi:hypothetical protein Bca4012_071321 [Brassica carinata]
MCSSPALHSLSLQRNPKGQSLLSSDSTSGELLLLDEKSMLIQPSPHFPRPSE